MCGVPGIMPSPMAVHGVEQGQAVDGQVAVEMILGVEDQGHADQDRPDQAQAQHHPGPARTSIGGARRMWSVMANWCGPRQVSDEEVAHGAAKTGQLGEILDDVVFVQRRSASSSSAR